MPTAAIYTRISRDEAGEHLGVDRQERLCRDLADRLGFGVAGEPLVDNDLSAYRLRRRPAFEQLVDMLHAGEVDAVLAYHADRLYRRTSDLERLVDIVEATGAQVHTVAAGTVDLSTASGRMVARMLGAAAQHESERIGERMKAKHDELAARGKHPGGRPPFGYGPKYVVEPAEAEVVRRIARRVLEGASLLSIAHELDADGVSTREGRGWHHSTVRAVVVNPAVAGLRVHRREIAGPGAWEPVLDRATWESVTAVLGDPARKRSKPARKFLLTGLLENENGDRVNGGSVGDRRVYSTRIVKGERRPKPHIAVPADALEAVIVEMVLAALDDAAIPEPVADASGAAEIAAIEAELDELAALRGAGTISLKEWMAAREPITARLEAARASVRHAPRPSPTSRLLSQRGAVRKAWPTLTVDEQRQVIAAVVERIIILPASRGRWTPIEERVGTVVWRA